MIVAAAGAGGRTEAPGKAAVSNHGGVAGMGGGEQQGAGTGTGTDRRGVKGGAAAAVRREVVWRRMGGTSGDGSSVTVALAAGVAAEAGAAAVVAVAGRGTAQPQTSRHGCRVSGSRRRFICDRVLFVRGVCNRLDRACEKDRQGTDTTVINQQLHTAFGLLSLMCT